MAKNNAYLNSGKTKESDECLTPRYGVEPIIKHLKAKGYKKIWCPFDTCASQFVRSLMAAGFIVYNSSLQNKSDFFKFEPRFFKYDCIVSNPPFSCKTKILKRLYALGKPFAIILPQNSLQAISRVEMFIDNGLEYLGFDRRLCFYTRGNLETIKFSNHFASGYFCKDVLPGIMIFEKLNQIQEPYFRKEK